MINKQKSIDLDLSITQEQKEFIDSIIIPKRLKITTDNPFDDINVTTSLNSWKYHHNGKNIHINFKRFIPYIDTLVKYYVFENAQNGTIFHDDLVTVLNEINTINLSFSAYKKWLEENVNSTYSRKWYAIKSFTEMLCRIEVPKFKDEDREKLLDMPNFSRTGSYLIYQNIENAFPSSTKKLIVNAIMEASSFVSSLNKTKLSDNTIVSNQWLQDWCIFIILYYSGARGVQFSKIAVGDIRIDSKDKITGLTRYSLLMPFAKKAKIPKTRFRIALPIEFGCIFEAYIKRYNLKNEDPLIAKNESISRFIKKVINRVLILIQPENIQEKIKNGEFMQPHLTPIDFRHNIGHSLAMAGASAEEIQYILGHSSKNVAKYYILATPQLALIKRQALGENPVWENMINLIMTGQIIDINEWEGKKVHGVIGDILHINIGGCNKSQSCHLEKGRSCYGCLYFRPSSDCQKHRGVLKSLESEIVNTIEISEKSGNINNPIIVSMANTKAQVQIVINRIEGSFF